MNLETVSLEETGCFSSLFIDYLNAKKSLEPFYGHKPQVKSFKEQIANKELTAASREVLVDVLETQYDGLEITDIVP